MGIAEKIGQYRSVAVAGLAKNVGKTVTLNYLLRESYARGLKIGVTSIGIDGETTDQVTGTGKPEITIYRDMLFATSELHYVNRCLQSEILDLGQRQTSLGKVVTARALSHGRVLLSGPADTVSLKQTIANMQSKGAETVLVDGAISRLSLASPAVTDAMILATGAALSPDISGIVRKTKFVCSLTQLPEVEETLAGRLADIQSGVWEVDDEGKVFDLGVKTALELETLKERLFSRGTRLYTPGIITERMLKFLSSQKEVKKIELIIKDFTRMFADAATMRSFIGRGGRIRLLRRSPLIGVTVNPYNPAGYSVDKDRLTDALQKELPVAVEYIRP